MTDEEPSVVDKWIATKKKTGYPIAILDGKLEEALGVKHFPYSGVLDPDGSLAFSGDSPESALKKSMKTAKPGSVWPKKLLPVTSAFRAGKLYDGWAQVAAMKTAGGLDEKETATLDRFEKYIVSVTNAAVKSAQELAKKDLAYFAVKKAEPVAASKPPVPASEDAQKLLAELKALPGYEAEMKGGEAFAGAIAKEDEDDFLGAVEAYKALAKKFAGSKIADAAMKQAQDLVSHGMPGFAPTCPKCTKEKKACEKHAKAVKL